MVGILTWQSPIPGEVCVLGGAVLFGGLQLRRSVGVRNCGEIGGALLFFGVAIALAVRST